MLRCSFFRVAGRKSPTGKSHNLLVSGGGTTSFQRRLINAGFFTSAVQLSNGDYAFAGTSVNRYDRDKQFVLRTDARGETLWMITFPEKNVGVDPIMEATPDNGLIVTLGLYSKMGLIMPQMVRLDSLGNREWKKAYPGNTSDKISALKRVGDGFLLTINNWQFIRSKLVKTDFSGNILWTKTYYNTHFYDIAEANTNGFILCGKNGAQEDSVMNEYVVRGNASANTMWTRKFTDGKESRALSVRTTPTGGFGVCSFSEDLSKAGFFRLLDANGASSTWQQFTTMEPVSMDLTADDQFVVAAFGNMYKIGSGGNVLWTKSKPNIRYAKILRTSDGGFIGIANLGVNDGYIVKTDALGN